MLWVLVSEQLCWWSLLFYLSVMVSMSTGDMPRCDKNNPEFKDVPYCIPVDYNKDLVPPTNGPLEINVDIWVFEVSKIDDIALAMTFELYFDLIWRETRLIVNETSPEWGPEGVMGSVNFVENMWLPDIQILYLKQFQKRNIVTDVAGLIIFKDKRILYTVSTEAIISCPMKFSAYPLDYQECQFQVGSYIHDETQILFSGTFGHDVKKQRAQQYEIEITDLEEKDKSLDWANRTYSLTGFKINMIRRRTPVLLQVYLPSGLFVLVSWISFIVPPEVVPGRMALLVTLFLVLVNIFNSVTANAPKAEGLTAVETWVVMCILHVFCVLLEYAIILKLIQTDKLKAERQRKALFKAMKQQGSYSGNKFSVKSSPGLQIAQQHRLMTGSSTPPLEQIFEADPDYLRQTSSKSGHMAAASLLNDANRRQQPHLHQHQPELSPLIDLSKRSSSHENILGNHTCGRHHQSAMKAGSQGHLYGLFKEGCRGGDSSNGMTEDVRDTETSWNKLDLSMMRNRTNSYKSYSSRFERIDRIAMWLFPIIFFVFNIAYWSYYLFLNEYIENLWSQQFATDDIGNEQSRET